MTNIHDTLTERAKTHGDYSDHAMTTQKIKDVIRAGRTYGELNTHERETLDMIAHKIGRIVSGNPHFHDHWHDIAGYATLSADRNRPGSKDAADRGDAIAYAREMAEKERRACGPRGLVETASGERLDAIAALKNVSARNPGETDADFRHRIKTQLTAPNDPPWLADAIDTAAYALDHGFMPWFGGKHAGDTKPQPNRPVEVKFRNGVKAFLRNGCDESIVRWDWRDRPEDVIGWRYV